MDDVVKMCCDSDNALCIDTTFNLCSSWVTDCCYNNDHLKTNEGKHTIFLGPTIVHFKKDALLFSRFGSEMLTHRPAISNFKKIGRDPEKTIFPTNQGFKAAVTRFPSSTERQRNLTELKS